MFPLPQPINNHPTNEQQDNNLPRVALLTEKQWSYLKKRYRMTSREFQIAKLVCQGLNNENIAEILHIKHGTVKTHIRNIYRKTWVHNKIAMLLRFVEDSNNLCPIKPTS